MRSVVLLAAGLAVAVHAVESPAQAYPSRAVRVVHGYAIGSAIDVFSRPLAQNVPTVSESGLPAFETLGWHGWLAPAGTSKDIVAQLNAALRKALAHPDLRAFWASNGIDSVDTTPEQFAARMRQDYERYGKVIARLGLAVK